MEIRGEKGFWSQIKIFNFENKLIIFQTLTIVINVTHYGQARQGIACVVVVAVSPGTIAESTLVATWVTPLGTK